MTRVSLRVDTSVDKKILASARAARRNFAHGDILEPLWVPKACKSLDQLGWNRSLQSSAPHEDSYSRNRFRNLDTCFWTIFWGTTTGPIVHSSRSLTSLPHQMHLNAITFCLKILQAQMPHENKRHIDLKWLKGSTITRSTSTKYSSPQRLPCDPLRIAGALSSAAL